MNPVRELKKMADELDDVFKEPLYDTDDEDDILRKELVPKAMEEAEVIFGQIFERDSWLEAEGHLKDVAQHAPEANLEDKTACQKVLDCIKELKFAINNL